MLSVLRSIVLVFAIFTPLPLFGDAGTDGAYETRTSQTSAYNDLLQTGLSERDQQLWPAAEASGRAAFALAATPLERFDAAQLVAFGLFAQRSFYAAEFWLRRAANDARTYRQIEQLREALTEVRRANPLQIDVYGSVTPSSNINGGSQDGILRLEGIDLEFVLPEDQQALSGVEIAFGVDLSYRLWNTPAHRGYLTASADSQNYLLSQEAKDQLQASPIPRVQDLTGQDFATLTTRLGGRLEHDRIIPLGPTSASISFGTFSEGGVEQITFRDTLLRQTVFVGTTRALSFDISQQVLWASLDSIEDTTTNGAALGFLTTSPNGDRWRVDVSAFDRIAGPETSYREAQMGIAYFWDTPIWGIGWNAGLSRGWREYDEFVTTLDGRRDDFGRVTITATFTEYDFYGFAPTMTVTGERTVSSAEENTSEALSVNFGIASRF